MKRLISLLQLILLGLTSFRAVPDDAVEALTLPRSAAIDGSLYELESEWFDQEGRNLPLRALKGKVRIVAMGYTSCKFACPRIIADLQRIEGELSKGGITTDQVGLSFISIDPEVDTPEVMKDLERKYQMDPKRWLLLTGDEDGVLELAVALGMKYRKTSAMDFAHSNIITLLSADGTIVHQVAAIGTDLSEFVGMVRASL